MASRPTFLRERLSVVSAWSNSSPAQESNPVSPPQAAALFLAQQELSPVRSELERCYNVAESRLQAIIDYAF